MKKDISIIFLFQVKHLWKEKLW